MKPLENRLDAVENLEKREFSEDSEATEESVRVDRFGREELF